MNSESSDLNLYQAATLLRLPPATIYLLASGGVIPCKRKRGNIAVNRDLLVSWARLWGERLKAAYSPAGGIR